PILPHVLHARLAEDGGHQPAADHTFGTDAGPATSAEETVFPICSTPTASATSCMPDATAIQASRKAVDPVAQALATFTTGSRSALSAAGWLSEHGISP